VENFVESQTSLLRARICYAPADRASGKAIMQVTERQPFTPIVRFHAPGLEQSKNMYNLWDFHILASEISNSKAEKMKNR
jgi:hypothetical protein